MLHKQDNFQLLCYPKQMSMWSVVNISNVTQMDGHMLEAFDSQENACSIGCYL
jgi:hypothetical protein